MRKIKLGVLMAALSCVGMITTPPVHAATRVPATQDVMLHRDGVLLGQVLDRQGRAVTQASIILSANGKEVAKTNPDDSGRFQVSGLQGGVYQISANGEDRMIRVWAPQTAPPSAQQGILLVDDSNVVRGQHCGSPVGCGGAVGGGIAGHGGGLLGWMIDRPILTSSIIAAAIAIPIATRNSGKKSTAPATP